MGAVARSADRRDARAGQRRPCVGSPGLGARRRHPAGPKRALLRALDISAKPVRRAARALPAPRLHLDRGNEGRGRTGPAEDHRRGAGGRRRLRPRPRADRRCDRAPVAHRADPARARDDPRLRGRSRRLLAVRPRARHRLRPRVRAGAADGDAARARPHAAAAGWRGRLVRVHGDALRSRSAAASTSAEPTTTERSIWGGLRKERVHDLQLSAGARGRRSRPGRRRSRASSTTCSTAAPRCSPASASASRPTASRCPSGSRRSRRTSAAR